MTDAKHTPGPWEVNPEVFADDAVGVLKGHVTIDAPTHGALAQVVWRMIDDGDKQNLELEANAHLIAAAPDLLTAAKDLCEYVEFLYSKGLIERPAQLAKAHAAIAKAEGRSTE